MTEYRMPPIGVEEQELLLICQLAASFPASDPYGTKSAEHMVAEYRQAVLRDVIEGLEAVAADDGIGGQSANYLGAGISYAASMVELELENGL